MAANSIQISRQKNRKLQGWLELKIAVIVTFGNLKCSQIFFPPKTFEFLEKSKVTSVHCFPLWRMENIMWAFPLFKLWRFRMKPTIFSLFENWNRPIFNFDLKFEYNSKLRLKWWKRRGMSWGWRGSCWQIPKTSRFFLIRF